MINYRSDKAVLFILCLFLACGPRKVTHKPAGIPQKAPSRWTYISDTHAIRDMTIRGDTVWALSGGKIIKANLGGGGQIESMDLGLSKKEWKQMNHILVDPGGDIWVGGGKYLYSIHESTLKHIDEVTLSFHHINFLAQTSEKRMYVGGDNFLITGDGTTWKLFELPFYITGGISTGKKVFMMADEKGIASINGNVISEYPHPLSRVKPYDKCNYTALSLAHANKELWVLWTGDGSYLSVLHPSGEWNIYTFPAGLTGMPQKLFSVGGRIYLVAALGIFSIEKGARKGTGLLPVSDTVKAVELTYELSGHDVFDPSTTKFTNMKPFAQTPVPRNPISAPDEVKIEKGREYTLVPFVYKAYSPTTVMRGDEGFVAVGTETMGISILRKNGTIVNEIFLYSAKPAMPFSSFIHGGSRVYYPMAGGNVGVMANSRIQEFKFGKKTKEKVLGADTHMDSPYVISLVPNEDIINVYRFQNGSFQKLYERTVDLATGIGSIGGFSISPDGTFWFTLKSFGEGQEMGAAELRPGLEELVFNGAIPVPSEHALIIPNGVSSISIKNDGTVYLGGMDGLVKISPDKSIVKYKESNGLVGDFVTDMAIDKNQRVWLLTVEGLGYMNAGKPSFPMSPPYRETAVACLGISNDGSAIMIDENGLRKYDGAKWKLLGARNEIVGAPIHDVQADGLGNIWVITDRAISIFKEL